MCVFEREIWFDLCGFGDRLRTRGNRRVQFPWVKMFRESTVAKFADVSNALELSLNCYVCGGKQCKRVSIG